MAEFAPLHSSGLGKWYVVEMCICYCMNAIWSEFFKVFLSNELARVRIMKEPRGNAGNLNIKAS